ncbi:MAG: hypothetical protein KAS97_12865 [Candidatus Aminicenantes bacterium]|nr:hypothetical protein [Candidatus Aminicenantes bacterium]
MKFLYFFILISLLVIPVTNCNVDEAQATDNNSGELPGDVITIIADHTSSNLDSIPDEWIDKVKEIINVHYCHTSHGSQIMTGLERLMNGSFSGSIQKSQKYNYYPDNCSMPDTIDYLSLMDGQYTGGYCETYVSPDLYWESSYGLELTRSMLRNNNVNVSIFAWCSQMDYYSSSELENYLQKISALEEEFPDVIFVYMTGNAQSDDRNRYDRNEQVRQYCRDNNKVLFDFADLDCWYNGEQHTKNGIPLEHPEYNGDEAGHTTFKSCENKGKAFWWLMARISGWDGN